MARAGRDQLSNHRHGLSHAHLIHPEIERTPALTARARHLVKNPWGKTMEDPARPDEDDVEVVFVCFAPMQFAGDAAHLLRRHLARAGEEKREPETSEDALPDGFIAAPLAPFP